MKNALFSVLIITLSICFSCSNDMTQGMFRGKIIVDHTEVLNAGQKNFPVLIALTDPDLKSTSNGGHVSQDSGEDIFFALPDGNTRLPYEITVYDAAKGKLEACVRIPLLSANTDTEIYLYYGKSSPDSEQIING